MYFFDPSLDCLVGLTSYIKAGLMNYEGIFIYNIMLLHSRPCLPPCTRMRPVLQQNSLQVFSCLPLSPPLCPQFCIQLVYEAEKILKKVAWIRSNHLQLQWKFKLWVGNFTWGNRTKHCWVMSKNFLFQKFVDISQQSFPFTP